MAVLGFLMAFGWVHRRELPGLAAMLGESLLWTAVMGIAAWQLIDNGAHAGGFLAGVILGLLAWRLPVVKHPTRPAGGKLRVLNWSGGALLLTVFAAGRLLA